MFKDFFQRGLNGLHGAIISQDFADVKRFMAYIQNSACNNLQSVLYSYQVNRKVENGGI